MLRKLLSLGIAMLAAALTACSDGTGGSEVSPGNGAQGTLIFNPPLRVVTITAADLTAQLSATPTGQQLLQIAGTPTCGIDVHYIQYGTIDGSTAGGVSPGLTTASGALMVPTGPAPACSGPRPMLLYAHGTAVDRTTNLANVPNNTEGTLIAAMFAAQGFIVIAPNYAGYDSSPLQYHPFLNGDQQSQEMIDALRAGRTALGKIPASSTTEAPGLLFLTGYSQGGYVAMAAAKAMQAQQGADPSLTVTALAAMSGPYALEAFGDMVVFGGVNLGATAFLPMLATSYQHQFGNIYNSPNDTSNVFEPHYTALGPVDAILPSNTPFSTLVSTGRLPQLGVFSSTAPTGTCNDPFFAANTPFTGGTPQQNALFALGFTPNAGDPSVNLIVNTLRRDVVCDAFLHPDGAFPTPTAGVPLAAAPAHPVRQATKHNDMRTWHPTPGPTPEPVLLCGGGNDPTVFFPTNTGTMAGTGASGSTPPNHAGTFWDAEATAGLVRVLDVDTAVLTAPNSPDGFDPLRVGFAAAKTATAQAAIAAGATDGGAAAVTQAYHGTLVPPFCSKATQGFFAQILISISFPYP